MRPPSDQSPCIIVLPRGINPNTSCLVKEDALLSFCVFDDNKDCLVPVVITIGVRFTCLDFSYKRQSVLAVLRKRIFI